MWMKVVAAVSLLAFPACSSKTESEPAKGAKVDVVDEAKIDYARKELAKLDAVLASDNPGDAHGHCSVLEPDLPLVRKADPKLATDLERRCGRDLAVAKLARVVAGVEKDPADCSRVAMFDGSIAKANADADPDVVKLRARAAVACPKK